MTTRRMILVTGGAAALVATGVGAWAWAPGKAPARAPWRQAGDSLGDPRLDALAYAILAPNAHNMQPWLFELIGDDRVRVTCDLDRRLPETDPPDRQTTISFGAMLELLVLAGAEKGYAVDISVFPEGEPQPRLDARPIAEATFTKDASVTKDPLFSELLSRRTSQAPFDETRSVEPDVVSMLIKSAVNGSSVGGSVEAAKIARLVDITKRGWRIEYENDATRRETISVMRIGNRAVAENPNGLALDGTALGLMNMAGLITPKTLDTKGSIAFEQGMAQYMTAIETARGFVWVTSETNTRSEQIAVGRDWVRMHLTAQKIGLSFHPLSQALQEFPEMAGPYRETQAELGVSAPGVVQMLGRIGYAKFPGPSPRWPLSSRLIETAA